MLQSTFRGQSKALICSTLCKLVGEEEKKEERKTESSPFFERKAKFIQNNISMVSFNFY